MDGLVFGGIGLVTELNAAQILHPADPLNAGHHQAQRVAVFGAQHLAVLAIGHQHLAVENLAQGNGAGHGRAVCALGQHKPAFFQVCARHLQQGDQRHASELAARQHAMAVLRGGYRHIAPLHTGVGAALYEMKARDAGQAHNLVKREHHRCFEHAGL